jgi:hypothetical protein
VGRGAVRRARRTRWAVGAVPAAALLLGALTLACPRQARAQTLPAHVSYARALPACAAALPGEARCFALVRVPAAQAGAPGVRPFAAGAGSGASTGPAGGLTPASLARAYGYEPSAGAAWGQTVAVVDAYDDPRIETDLATFDGHYGLGECTKADGCLRKLNQEGLERPLPSVDKSGWSWEISLDVETVRAVCRRCHILLVEAKSPEYKNLAAAARAAVAHGATELSNSYGGPEGDLGGAEAAAYNAPGVVVTAATGDLGWDDWNYLLEGFAPPAMPNAPASLPTVVSVGGTTLDLNAAGARSSETVWNDGGPDDENKAPPGYVTGGGCSTRFAAEPWQREAAGYAAAGCSGKRLSADVAADGDPLTGFDVYDDFNFCGTGAQCTEVTEAIARYGGWETFGGTSLASPIIASMYALAGGSAGLRYPALTLYAHLGDAAALYDVRQGGNGICDGTPAAMCGSPNSERAASVDCEGTTACDAAAGLDGPSGVGAPVGLAAFEPLFPTARITLPAEVVAGAAATLSGAASEDPNPGATFSSWSWSFGDGSASSSAASPVHTFAAPGEYTVTMSLLDSYGLAGVPARAVVTVISRTEEEARAKAEEEARAKAEEETRTQSETHPAPTTTAAGPARGGAAGGVGVAAFQIAAAPLLAHLEHRLLRVARSGRVLVRLRCPAGVGLCTGTVTLRLGAGAGAVRGRGHARPGMNASEAFSIAGGRSASVALRLGAAALALLARAHTVRAVVTVDSALARGASRTVASAVTLRLLARAHRAR